MHLRGLITFLRLIIGNFGRLRNFLMYKEHFDIQFLCISEKGWPDACCALLENSAINIFEDHHKTLNFCVYAMYIFKTIANWFFNSFCNDSLLTDCFPAAPNCWATLLCSNVASDKVTSSWLTGSGEKLLSAPTGLNA